MVNRNELKNLLEKLKSSIAYQPLPELEIVGDFRDQICWGCMGTCEGTCDGSCEDTCADKCGGSCGSSCTDQCSGMF